MSRYRVWDELDGRECEECGRVINCSDGILRSLCAICSEKRQAALAAVLWRDRIIKGLKTRSKPAIYLGEDTRGRMIIHEPTRREMREIAVMRLEQGLPSVWNGHAWIYPA